MKTTIKRSLIYVILPTILMALPYTFVSGKAPSYDYYFKANNSGDRPEICPEATFLNEYKNVITIGADTKKVYLTFDAGYDNGNMEKILDTLKEKEVPAAFFVDGNFVKNESSLTRRICEEGHILGNHSLSHADMSTLTDFDQYKQQIEGWEECVNEAGAVPSKFFRFPCGRFSESALQYNEELGLTSVFWSFAYYDWDPNNQPDKTAALQKILSRTHNGCVLLLHSVSATNADILPTLIDRLKLEGYTFGTLQEI